MQAIISGSLFCLHLFCHPQPDSDPQGRVESKNEDYEGQNSSICNNLTLKHCDNII